LAFSEKQNEPIDDKRRLVLGIDTRRAGEREVVGFMHQKGIRRARTADRRPEIERKVQGWWVLEGGRVGALRRTVCTDLSGPVEK
jgi:hypothetical protein